MARKVDKEVLEGFIEEAKSYLPLVLQSIETARVDPTRLDAVEEAHRHSHTIKGASAMVGIASLSHIAYYIEEILEEILTGNMMMDEDTAVTLCKMVTSMDGYLDGLSSGTLREQPILSEVVQEYRRLRGLPEEETEDAVEELLAEVTGPTSTASIDEDKSSAEMVFELPGKEEVSPELIETFVLEAEDHLSNINAVLTSLDKHPEETELVQSVRRSVHTLKGAAGAVGLRAIAQLSHRMEDLLDQLYDGKLVIDDDIMDLLFTSADALDDLSLGRADIGSLQEALQDLYSRYSTVLGTVPSEEKPPLKLEPLGEGKIIDIAELTPHPKGEIQPEETEKGSVPVPRTPSEVVRVPLDRLDDLVRLVSELVINRSVFEQRMMDFTSEVDELHLSVDRLRRVSSSLETQYEVRALAGRLMRYGESVIGKGGSQEITFDAHGFDDLEFDRYTEFHLLSRELAETTSDIRTVNNELITLIGDFDSIMNRQGRLSSEIQDKLMRTRMMPLATLATRLHRAVRVLARERGKLVDLVLEGEEIELDKTVLEEIADPLLHLLRNAVDHGIEPPELRQVMGKQERGLIYLQAFHEGNQVVIQVSDDGAGLEPQILRSAAIRRGYITEVDAPQLTNEELYSLIFLPGFSTAGEVSEVSGRGVGLDIVKTNVLKLKGAVTLDTTPGKGTTFTIRLPMTLAVTRALMVKANNEVFAVPLDSVSQIVRLEREEIERVGQEPVIRVEEQVYPMLRLGDVLSLEGPTDPGVQRLPVLIINTGAEQVALVVDQLLAGREIVIKTLGNHLRRVHGVSGATLMGDGRVVLILNPADLVVTAPKLEIRSDAPIKIPASVEGEALAVMIVDDSISVRRVVSNLIRSVGWLPLVAKDGLEALEIIQRSAQLPDLILVDIEMPRMDGYELMSTLKAHDEYQEIPLVVLTSRAGEKHRRRALELGASDYVVKPYQDELLLNIIRQLSVGSRGAVSV